MLGHVTEFHGQVGASIGARCRDSRFPIVSGGKWGFINGLGNLAIEPKFSNAFSFSEGLALVNKDGALEYINKVGKVVMSSRWFINNPRTSRVSDGRVLTEELTRDGARFGFVDTNGRARVPMIYYSASPFSNGLAKVQGRNGLFGFIDRNGNMQIRQHYAMVDDFSEDLAAVSINGKWGFLDKNGRFVITPRFADARRFSDGLAGVKIDRKWGFVDKIGNLRVPARFDYVGLFSDGLAPAKMNGKWNGWGYIDRRGRVAIKPKFAGAYSFSEARAIVSPFGFQSDLTAQMNNNFGFIDSKGLLVIPYHFQVAFSFFCGLAGVTEVTTTKERLEGYIDTTGRYVWQPSM